jgi:hypothetical protein
MADPKDVFKILFDVLGEDPKLANLPKPKAAAPAAQASKSGFTKIYEPSAGAQPPMGAQPPPKPVQIPITQETPPTGGEDYEASTKQWMKDLGEGKKPADATPPGQSQMTPEQGKAWVKAWESQNIKPAEATPNLPMDEAAREKRRMKGGFTTEAHRGGDFFNYQGSKVYLAANKDLAALYDDQTQKLWLNTNDYYVANAKGKNWNEAKYKIYEQAKKQGAKGIIVHNVADEPDLTSSRLGPQTTYVVWDLNTMRRPGAAFDPAKMGEQIPAGSPNHLRNMLASGAAVALGGGIAGVTANKSEAAPLPKVFHVSPNDFEKFAPLAERVGKGGEAETFEKPQLHMGPGYYFAEAEGVRNHYEKVIKQAYGKAYQYENTLNASSNQLVDFDKALEEQAPGVKKALAALKITDLQQLQTADLDTVKRLNQMGVKGIQFFDSRSRAKGEGTRNYVVFDPDTINIMKKTSLATLLGGGGAAAMFAPDKAQAAETSASGFTRVTEPEKPAEGHLEAIKRASGEIYEEGKKEITEGAKGVSAQMAPENLRAYQAYTKAYQEWEDSGGKGDPPKPPSGVGPTEFLKAVFGTVGGVFTAASPAGGAGVLRAEVSEPLEKKTGIPKWATEMVGSLVLPGFGVVKYGKAVKPAYNLVATTLNKIFNPELIGAGQRAETVLRAGGGIAARDEAAGKAALDDYYNRVDAMQPHEQLLLDAYIEGRTGGATLHDPSLQGVADTIKTQMDKRKTKLSQLPSTHQMNFVTDYLSHADLWQNPSQAKKFYQGWVAKQGSGKSLNKRTVPTIADGIAAGLVPKTTNPIDISTRYMEQMDRFIFHNAVIDQARATKEVKYFKNLSKNPESPAFNPTAQKLGLVPLNGRLGIRHTKHGDFHAFADADWARVYNNHVGMGLRKGEIVGPLYDTLQRASNGMTAVELGLSGYHLLTMVHEAAVADAAVAMSQAVSGVGALGRGQIGEAARLLRGSAANLIKQPAAAFVKPYMGHKVQQVYLGRMPGTAQMRQIVDLLELAGGRAVGARHAADYQFSSGYSYFRAFRKLSDVIDKNAYTSTLKSIKRDYAPGTVFPAPVAFLGRQIGRAMTTISDPLFKTYIPKMKTGAFHQNMKAWLDANPAANKQQQVAMARKIWDSIDNRFGEMVNDNVFWNQAFKQAAQLGMRSYSWNLGTIREIGGGAKSLVTKPKSLGIKGADYDPKTGYVIALPMVAALSGYIYQKLMTGKNPESIDDLFHPRTGGVVPGFGGGKPVEERATLPGYMKDVFGWAEDWRQEAANKRSALLTRAWELGTNRQTPYGEYDLKQHPIVPPDASMEEMVGAYFKYAEKFLPITVQRETQGPKKGSHIDKIQSRLGISPAGARFTDPVAWERYKKSQHDRVIREEKIKEKKQKRIYGPSGSGFVREGGEPPETHITVTPQDRYGGTVE